MTSRERVQNCLNHKSIDKVVVDFGATPVTGIHVSVVEKLREYYGLEKRPVKVVEPYQMLGEVDDQLKDCLLVDVQGIWGKNNMFGFANEGGWKEFKTFWGQTILVPEMFNYTYDGNGDLLMYTEGDTSIEPCAKMPKTSFFFDAIIRQQPLEEEKLNPEDNLEEFNAITSADLAYWQAKFNSVKDTERAIIANFGGTALGDIALVPAMNLRNPKGIRDITEWYMSTVMRPDYIHQVFEKQTDTAIENLTKLFAIVGNRVDAVFICGTDFGTQTSQFCSGETFDELYLPYYKKVNNWIHAHTSWKTFKHSCGAVEPLLDNLINAGFDIINPVQINAQGMDSKLLKEKYGSRLTFWGGGVDTQRVLSFGTPAEVEKQVLEQCRTFAINGGFVFNTVHNIQANTPIDNIVAMVDAVRKFNGE